MESQTSKFTLITKKIMPQNARIGHNIKITLVTLRAELSQFKLVIVTIAP